MDEDDENKVVSVRAIYGTDTFRGLWQLIVTPQSKVSEA